MNKDYTILYIEDNEALGKSKITQIANYFDNAFVITVQKSEEAKKLFEKEHRNNIKDIILDTEVNIIDGWDVNATENYIAEHPECLNIACVLLDMVDDSDGIAKCVGLDFINHIRNKKNDHITQIIIYTGQLGEGITLDKIITSDKKSNSFRVNDLLENNDAKIQIKIALRYYYDIQDVLIKSDKKDGAELMSKIHTALETYKQKKELTEQKKLRKNVLKCVNVYQQHKKHPELVKKLQEAILKHVFGYREYDDIPKVESSIEKSKLGRCFFLVLAYPNSFETSDIKWLDGKSYDKDTQIMNYHIDSEVWENKEKIAKKYPAFFTLDKCKNCNKNCNNCKECEIYIEEIYLFNDDFNKRIKTGFLDIYIPEKEEKGANRDSKDQFIRTTLFLPIYFGSDNTEKQCLGVLSIQTSLPEITENQLDALRMLANYIAGSIRVENEELKNLNKAIKTIAECDMKNLIPQDWSETDKTKIKVSAIQNEKEYKENFESKFQINKLFIDTFELLFGKSKDNDKDNLYSFSIWRKEKANEYKGKDFFENQAKEKSFNLDELDEIMVNYCYEMNKYTKNVTDIITPREIFELTNYNRPANFCLAYNKKQLDSNKELYLVELYDWKGKTTLESECNFKNITNFEQLSKEEKMQFYDKLTKDKQEKCLESYRKYLDEEVVAKGEFKRPTELKPEDFLFKSANKDGLLVNSLLFYPIVSNNKVEGVLSFQHNEPYYFDDTHRQYIKLIATLLGNRLAVIDEKKREKIDFISTMGSLVTHSTNNIAGTLQANFGVLKSMKIEDTFLNFYNINPNGLDSGKTKELEDQINDSDINEVNRKDSEELLSKLNDFDNKFNVENFLEEKLFNFLNIKNNANIIENTQLLINAFNRTTSIFNQSKLLETSEIESFERFIKKIEKETKVCIKETDLWKCERIKVSVSTNSTASKNCYTHKYLLEVVFSNLIKNTIDHALKDEDKKNPEKKIDVYINIEIENKEVKIIYKQEGGRAIPNEIAENLFQLGNSEKATGGGIGLYGIKYLIDNYLCDENRIGRISFNKEQNKKDIVEFEIKYRL